MKGCQAQEHAEARAEWDRLNKAALEKLCFFVTERVNDGYKQ